MDSQLLWPPGTHSTVIMSPTACNYIIVLTSCRLVCSDLPLSMCPMWGETKAARAITGELGKPLLAALWILCTLPWLGLAVTLLESEVDIAVVDTGRRAVQGRSQTPSSAQRQNVRKARSFRINNLVAL